MSMNREERRALKKKIAPIAQTIANLELQAKDPAKKEQAEAKIGEIMESLTLIEMMAIEDYIISKGLLKESFDRDYNKNLNDEKENQTNGKDET